MKAHRKTLWIFLATVAVFWLALGLTSFIPRISRDDWEEKQVTMPDLAGITTIEIKSEDKQGPAVRGGEITLEFADSGDAAVAHLAGQTASVTAETLFDRKGDKLFLHVASRGIKMSHINESDWWVDKVVLPRSITRIHSADLPVKVLAGQAALTTLTISGTSVEVNAERIDALDITSHARAICDEPCTQATARASSVEVTGKNIAKVTIAIAQGSVRLNGTETVQGLHLRTTPDTAIYLDRIDAFKRMDWQALTPSREAELAKPLAPCPPKAPASTPEAAAQAASDAAKQKAQCAAAAAAEEAAQTATQAKPNTGL